MATLAEFVLARISEDEAVARDAASEAATPWRATYGRQVETSLRGYLVTPEDTYSDEDDPTSPVASHIARHDPARVLAECAAKRAIVEDATGQHTGSIEGWHMVEILAAVYADHRDYQPEWAPA